MTWIINIIIALVAVASAVFAYIQVREAKKALKQARVQSLFIGFDQASQVTVEHPELLKSVHGLDLDIEECRSIAYLSILMDAFQHYYGSTLKDGYQALQKGPSTFLDKITSVPGNRERWEQMKRIYYGDFDKKFVAVINSKFEKQT